MTQGVEKGSKLSPDYAEKTAEEIFRNCLKCNESTTNRKSNKDLPMAIFLLWNLIVYIIYS